MFMKESEMKSQRSVLDTFLMMHLFSVLLQVFFMKFIVRREHQFGYVPQFFWKTGGDLKEHLNTPI